MTLLRLSDDQYFFEQHATDVFLDFQNTQLSVPDQRYLALWLSQQESQPLRQAPSLLEYQGKVYRVSPTKDTLSSHVTRIIAEATNFIRDPHAGNKKIYRIEEENTLSTSLITRPARFRVEGTPKVCVSMRDDVTAASTKERLSQPHFSDPYTLLAEKAFTQGFEKAIIAKDKPEKAQSAFIFDSASNELQLVFQNEIPHTPEAVYEAVTRYRQFLASEYGKEKLAYMEHMLGINLADMTAKNEPLTPEIVYRFNVTSSLVEIQDLKELWDTLKRVSKKLPPEANLIEALQTKIPLFELRGLTALLAKGHDPTTLSVGTLQQFVQELTDSNRVFDRLMDIYDMPEVDHDRMYTGKKIFSSIQSDYTRDQYGERKIFVDLQELAQVAEEHHYDETRKIPEAQKEAAFFERLTHVIVKKQLVHRHPESALRIGMLIPARPAADGTRQWYVVTSCTRTNYGKCFYTLEPTSKASTLPNILLNRSTFSSDDPASVQNDVNRISGPGYEGYGLTAQFEDSFVRQSTIPVWVGYAMWAEQTLTKTPDKDTANVLFSLLDRATEELVYERKKALQPLSYDAIIQKYDYVLQELIYTDLHKLTSSEKKQLLTLLDRFTAQEYRLSDITTLTKILEKSTLKQHIDFQKELNEFVRRQEKGYVPVDLNKTVEQERKIQELRSLQRAAKNDVAVCRKWLQVLLDYAKDKGEHPSEKNHNGVAIAGHSLGGALSQIAMVHHTAHQERIPLGMMKAWIFDAPAIHERDCKAFYDFGRRHHEMMQALGSRFAIFSSQEVGDPVVLGGEQHLGGVKTEKEAAEQAQWLDFNATLFDINPKTSTRALRDTYSRHATRFQTRESDNDVHMHAISPTEQYAFDMADTLQEWAKFQQKWKIMPLADSYIYLSPTRIEKFRKWAGHHVRTHSSSLLTKPQETERLKSYSNATGVFSIGLTGIKTKYSRTRLQK